VDEFDPNLLKKVVGDRLVLDFSENGRKNGVAVAAHEHFKGALVTGCVALDELGILNLRVQHSWLALSQFA
jgi:hypothetical protein